MDSDLFKQNVQVILLMLGFLILPSFLLLMQRRNVAEKRKLPPGPFRLPLIGNLHQLRGLPHRSFQGLSDKYGPLMLLQLGSVLSVVISSADMAREIFKSHDLIFSSRPVMYAAKKLSYGCIDIAFSPYGQYWRDIRKIAVLELLSAKKVQSFEHVRKEEVAHMMALIASSSNGLVDLSEELGFVVNNIVCRVAFGRKFEKTNNRKKGFQAFLQDTQDLLGGFRVGDLFPWLGWIHKLDGLDTKLEKTFWKMDKFYNEIIEEHLNPDRPKHEVEDLVDVMLRVQRDPSQDITLTTDHIKGVIMDVFVAGTDPASATLVWTITELIRNPSVMKKLQDDLREVVGVKEVVEESDLPRMKYLKVVLKEAMRLHPPAPLPAPRETTKSCVIQGYHIPAKTRVFINAKSIASDPRTWENPEQFLPERFLDKPMDFQGTDYEFVPFGIGRRGCPGMNFAVVLMELVLANLLHGFNWELPPGVEREDVDMKEAFGLTTFKKVPLCLIARKPQNKF